MSALLACISHKGGTGRTVTTANIAYQLAMQGKNVCIVDLDLASPTLGSVVGLDDIAAGTPVGEGIHDILIGDRPSEDVLQIQRDVWHSDDIRPSKTFACGAYSIVPGRAGGGDGILTLGENFKDLHRNRLGRSLNSLLNSFDFVFCDLRSGIGNVAEAFLSRPVAERLDAWLLFHRWTRQHLVGAIDLAQRLSNATNEADDGTQKSVRFMRIRTASIDMDSVKREAKVFVDQQHDKLLEESSRFDGLSDPPLEEIGCVPLEPTLQWTECILTRETEYNEGKTVAEFQKLANFLVANFLVNDQSNSIYGM